jgi:hypothetical protein
VGRVRVVHLPNPLSPWRRHDAEHPAGLSLIELAGAAGIKDTAGVVAFIDDQTVMAELFHRVRPKPGRSVWFVGLPGGGGGGGQSAGKQIALVVAQLAITVGSIAVGAGPLGAGVAQALGVSARIGGAIVAAGLSIGANIALRAVIGAPEQNLGRGDQKPTHALTGASNQYDPFGSVPLVLGTAEFYPKKIGEYTRTRGEDSWLHVLLLLGWGPLQLNWLKIGDEDVEAFPSVVFNFYPGRATDGALSMFKDDIKEEGYSLYLPKVNGPTVRTFPGPGRTISFDLTAPYGIHYLNGEGALEEDFVVFTVRYRVVGAPTWIAWPELVEMRGRTRTAFHKNWELEVPGGSDNSTYEIEFTRERTDTDAANKHQVTVYLTALRAIRDQPSITLRNVSVIEMRIKADETNNGILNDVKVSASALVRSWNGSVWAPDSVSSNPGDLFRHLLQGQHLATPAEDDEIDLPSVRLFQEASTAAGWTWDAVIDDERPLFEALRACCSAGRGALVQPDGRYGVALDQSAGLPVQHFNPARVFDFEAERNFEEVPHALRARWINRDLEWQDDEEPVFRDGYSAAGGAGTEAARLYEVLDLRWLGGQSWPAIWKHARLYIMGLHLRRTVYRFSTNINALRMVRSDKFSFAHYAAMLGEGFGRLVDVVLGGAGGVTGVVLDQAVAMQPGPAYQVVIHGVGDDDQDFHLVRAVVNPGATGAYSTLTFTTAVTGEGRPEAGDVYTFGRIDETHAECVAMSIKPLPNHMARIEGIEAAPEVLDAIDGPAPPRLFGRPTPILRPPSGRRPGVPVIVQGRAERIGGGQADLVVVVSRRTGGVPPNVLQTQMVAAGGTNWGNTRRHAGTAIELVAGRVAINGDYDIRVRAIGSNGQASAWSGRFTIDSAAVDPQAPSGGGGGGSGGGQTPGGGTTTGNLPVITAEMIGLVGDGVTNDGQALNEAFQHPNNVGRKFMLRPPAGVAFFISELVNFGDYQQIDWTNSQIRLGKVAGLRAFGSFVEVPETGKPRLAANAAEGATTIQLELPTETPGALADFIKVNGFGRIRALSDAAGNALIRQDVRFTSVPAAPARTGAVGIYPPIAEAMQAVYPNNDAYEERFGTTDKTYVGIKVTSLITADVFKNNYSCTVVDGTKFKAGDMVAAVDDALAYEYTTSTRQSMNPVHRQAIGVKAVAGNVVTFDRAIRTDILQSKFGRLELLAPITGVLCENARVVQWEAPEQAPAPRIEPFEMGYARNCHFRNLIADSTGRSISWRGNTFRTFLSLDCSWFNIMAGGFKDVDSGDGYGLSFYYAVDCSAEIVHIEGARHSVLFQGGKGCLVQTVHSEGCRVADIDFHGLNEADNLVSGVVLVSGTLTAPDGTTRTGIAIGNTFHLFGAHGNVVRDVVARGYSTSNHRVIRIEPPSTDNLVENIATYGCRNIIYGRANEDDRSIQALRNTVRNLSVFEPENGRIIDLDGTGSEAHGTFTFREHVLDGVIIRRARQAFHLKRCALMRVRNLFFEGRSDWASAFAFAMVLDDCPDLRLDNPYIVRTPGGLTMLGCSKHHLVRPVFEELTGTPTNIVLEDRGGNGGGSLWLQPLYPGTVSPSRSGGASSIGGTPP